MIKFLKKRTKIFNNYLKDLATQTLTPIKIVSFFNKPAAQAAGAYELLSDRVVEPVLSD